MKLPSYLNPELLVSTDKTRERITHAFLEIKDGQGILCVTDGRRLMRLKVELSEGDVAGYIPKQALALAKLQSDPTIFCAVDELTIPGPNRITMPRPRVSRIGDYPNTSATTLQPTAPAQCKIALNAELLVEIQRACGSTCVHLIIHGESQPIVVRAVDKGNSAHEGEFLDANILLMPVRA